MKLAGPLGLVLEPLLALAYNHQNWDVHNHGLKPGFKWHRPFPEDGHDPGGFTVPCKHIEEFHAHQIKMADIREPFPDGLAPWADAVEAFFDPRTYPGGWDGANLKGTNRDLLVMEYKDVPRAVREWIASRQSDLDSDDRWLYAIFEKPKSKTDTIIATVAPSPSATDTELSDKIMVFAPGALYENLPLWVAKGSKCEGKVAGR